MILLVRPAAVLLSSFGTELTWKEQAFLMWLAPRGIVAAAVASLFSLRLQEIYPEAAEALVALVFLVIVGTVALYGLTITPLARWLGLAHPNPQGVLFVGAHAWGREMADALQEQGIKVLLTDTNARNVREARKKGLPAQHTNVLSETVIRDLELGGLGHLIALTPNDEINALAALHFAEVFGSTNVFQLSTRPDGSQDRESEFPKHLRGFPLFGGEETYSSLAERFQHGATLEAFPITEEFTYEDFQSKVGEDALPLFVISKSGKLGVYSEKNSFSPETGQVVLAIVDPSEAEHPQDGVAAEGSDAAVEDGVDDPSLHEPVAEAVTEDDEEAAK
jgi:hypothetical protein